HEGFGFQKKNFRAGEFAFRGLALKAPPPRREPMAAVNRIDGEETDIVPVPGMARPRIAESREQKHGLPPRPRLFRLLLALVGSLRVGRGGRSTGRGSSGTFRRSGGSRSSTLGAFGPRSGSRGGSGERRF